jgi:hypothetical protein
MKTRRKLRTAPALVGLLLLLAPFAKANAQTNVCARLLENLVLPVELIECLGLSPVCLAVPHCCVPGACLVDPVCASLKIISSVNKVVQRGELYCDFSPDELVDRWLKGQVELTAEVLTGGLLGSVYEVLDANIAVLEAGSRPPLESTKLELRELVAPLYDHGDRGYSFGDIDSVTLVPASFGNAALYLRDAAGVTVSNVVILKDEHYQALFNAGTSLDDFQWNRTPDWSYALALDVLSHELVHVAQFRRYGKDTFRTNYLVDYLAGGAGDVGYQRSVYEKEAYEFEAELAQAAGGPYCEYARLILQGHSEIAWPACHPYGPWLSSIFAALCSD